MNEQEARHRLTEYLQFLQGDIGYSQPLDWLSEKPDLHQLPNGDWVAKHPEVPHNGVLLKLDGMTFPFFGALGKFVDRLGQPVSREHFLASASLGRYQAYDKGLAVWEQFDGSGDLGFPVAQWESFDQRARTCSALIAFFDLRGFTNWSKSQDANQIQDVIEKLERSFQDSFSRRWCIRLFSKGTGDGFMVVSEAGWFNSTENATDGEFQPGHVKAFCQSCAMTIKNASQTIPQELAIGCGITVGEITQLYLLGRYDYIGPQINEASKIQSVAYNELCISDRTVQLLMNDGLNIQGKTIPGKGLRVNTESLINI